MKNLSQFGPAVWAVGGVAIDFGHCTSCISGTSVFELWAMMNVPKNSRSCYSFGLGLSKDKLNFVFAYIY